MAQEHLNNIITAAGIAKEDFDAILALPADAADFKPEDYVGKIKTNMETLVKNDPKFWEGLDENNVNDTLKKKIEAQQYGRASNIVKQKTLKALGLKEEDLKNLSEEDKKQFEVYVSKAAETFAATKTGDKEMQKQLQEARQKLEDLETDIPTREGKIKQEYEAKYNNEKLDFIILAELGTLDNLKTPAKYLVDRLSKELKEENAFVVNGLNANPKQKANPNLDILEGSKVLTLKDLIVKKLTADGMIGEPATAKQSGTTKATVEPNGSGGLAISSHIADKIKANTTAAK